MDSARLRTADVRRRLALVTGAVALAVAASLLPGVPALAAQAAGTAGEPGATPEETVQDTPPDDSTADGTTDGTTDGTDDGTDDDTTDGTTDGTDTGADDTTDRRPRRVGAALKVATFNTAATLRAGRAVRDVVRLSRSGVDVIGLQEMASAKRRKGVHQRLVGCRGCAWAEHVPAGSTRGSTPIYWRKKQYRKLAAGSRFVSPRTFVGASGAGPARANAKYVTWVRLQEKRTGRVVWVLNNHLVASVQGKGGGPDQRRPRRLALYKRHMAVLQDMVRACTRRGGLVLVTGDFNVNFRTDRRVRAHRFPAYRLSRVGLRNSFGALGEPGTGTHALRSGRANRLIDHVWFTPRPTLEPRKQRILRGFASDHRPLVVKMRVTARRR